MCATWITAYAAQGVVRAWLDGVPWYVPLMPMSSAAFIIFTLYMIPDPATSPLIWWRQMLFSAAVAMVYGLLVITQHVFGLFLALFSVCLVRGLSIAIYTRFILPKRQAAPARSPGVELAAAT